MLFGGQALQQLAHDFTLGQRRGGCSEGLAGLRCELWHVKGGCHFCRDARQNLAVLQGRAAQVSHRGDLRFQNGSLVVGRVVQTRRFRRYVLPSASRGVRSVDRVVRLVRVPLAQCDAHLVEVAPRCGVQFGEAFTFRAFVARLGPRQGLVRARRCESGRETGQGARNIWVIEVTAGEGVYTSTHCVLLVESGQNRS